MSLLKTAGIQHPSLGTQSITIDGTTGAVSFPNGPSIGDITAVTAGIGISGGGSSGDVTITNSMATAIDAKGDLVVGTGADTFSKLTVGANGTTLVADSGEATGLRWSMPASGGKILQVVQGTTTTATVINSISMSDTGLTATITPSSSSSKILITATSPVRLYRGSTSGGQNELIMRHRLMRDSTTLAGGTGTEYLRQTESSNGYDAINTIDLYTVTYLDSPNTTSATVYKVQAMNHSTNQGAYIEFQPTSSFGSITLLEVGA